MATIADVQDRHGTLFVKDGTGKTLFQIAVGSAPNDGLKGYTGSSVNVQKASTVFTYDASGRITNQRGA